MNLPLLQQWLGLPAGAWPPDDRVLLGLPAGPVDAALAEQNALARMETLRPHQLLHPELVTEGMNRLAQALIAVSAPPLTATTRAPVEFDFLPELSRQSPVPPGQVRPLPLPLPTNDIADADAVDDEVVEAEVVELPPPPPVPPPRPLVQLEADPLVLLDDDLPLPPAGATATRADRRKLYRELRGRHYSLMGIVCSEEPLMLKWKWALTARVPAKVFVINENGDYFWLDRMHLKPIRNFVLLRAGLAGSGAVRTLARVVSFPFTLLFLLLYATTVHTRRALRKATS